MIKYSNKDNYSYGGVKMSNSENPKSGDRVEQSGVYFDEWNQVEILKKGSRFPKDPMFGKVNWQLAHYPFDNQITSKNIPEEFWNEIDNPSEKTRDID